MPITLSIKICASQQGPYLVKWRNPLFSIWETEPERVKDYQNLTAGPEGPCSSWFSLLGLAASEADGQSRLSEGAGVGRSPEGHRGAQIPRILPGIPDYLTSEPPCDASP